MGLIDWWNNYYWNTELITVVSVAFISYSFWIGFHIIFIGLFADHLKFFDLLNSYPPDKYPTVHAFIFVCIGCPIWPIYYFLAKRRQYNEAINLARQQADNRMRQMERQFTYEVNFQNNDNNWSYYSDWEKSLKAQLKQ